MGFCWKMSHQAVAPEMQWLLFLFSFELPITECWQNIFTAFLWFTASPLLSNSEGHGGPVAARQKPPAPPVSCLLQQGDEREDKVIMGKVRIKMDRKLPSLPMGQEQRKMMDGRLWVRYWFAKSELRVAETSSWSCSIAGSPKSKLSRAWCSWTDSKKQAWVRQASS